MKNKYLPITLYQKLIKPNDKMTFWLTSPIPAINFAPQTLFMATHGVSPILNVSSICGTAYACRLDWKDVKPLNWDLHSIQVDNSQEQLELKFVEPQKYDFHHSTKLPEFIEKDAPLLIKNMVSSIISSIR